MPIIKSVLSHAEQVVPISPIPPPAQRRSPFRFARLNAPTLMRLGAFFVAVNDR
jgi:hypothetical protein